MSNTPTFGIAFDESKKIISEVMGMSDSLHDRILSRLNLFNEEENREIKRVLVETLGEKKTKQLAHDAAMGDEEAVAKMVEVIGHHPAKTMTLANFLQSTLFKTLDFTPKTPNDYLMLGYIFAEYAADGNDGAPEGVVEAMKEMVREAAKLAGRDR